MIDHMIQKNKELIKDLVLGLKSRGYEETGGSDFF